MPIVEVHWPAGLCVIDSKDFGRDLSRLRRQFQLQSLSGFKQTLDWIWFTACSVRRGPHFRPSNYTPAALPTYLQASRLPAPVIWLVCESGTIINVMQRWNTSSHRSYFGLVSPEFSVHPSVCVLSGLSLERRVCPFKSFHFFLRFCKCGMTFILSFFFGYFSALPCI